MVFINDIDGQSFSLNGITYFKNFLPHTVGENTRIVNQYDTRFELVGFKNFSEFSVNGIVYETAWELQTALLPVLYTRSTLGGSGSVNENILISIGVIERDGNDFTVPGGTEAKFGSSNYTFPLPYEFTIELEDPGYKRIDALILRTTGFELISGEPYTDIITTPDIPNSAILVKEYRVDGATIEDTDPPIIGDTIVQKVYYSQYTRSFAGVQDAPEFMMPFGWIRLTGACSQINSLNIIYAGTGEGDIFGGHTIGIKNNQPIAVLLKHLSGTGNFKFWFPDALDYLVQPGEIVYFTIHYALYRLEFISTNKLISTATIRTTPQFTITGNTTLSNIHNGAILKIKATCTLTVPAGLIENFSCVSRTFSGYTATWVEGSGFTLDAPSGKIQEPLKLVTFVKDGNTNTGFLEGGLKL